QVCPLRMKRPAQSCFPGFHIPYARNPDQASPPLDKDPAWSWDHLHGYQSDHLFRQRSATVTRPIKAGTSTSGPTTAANAAPEWRPKTPTATAIASSKLLPAAVNASV